MLFDSHQNDHPPIVIYEVEKELILIVLVKQYNREILISYYKKQITKNIGLKYRTKKMWLKAYLIFMSAMSSLVTQNCIWVPIGYVPTCGYRYHHVNQRSSTLCWGPGPKVADRIASYEIQYGCEKRSFEFELRSIRELQNICCSKTDISNIFKYFRKT